jgi:hypothetical protein
MSLWCMACCSLLGDERTVEPMNRGVGTKRRERVVLVVIERSRLGAVCLAEAYEQVVPIVQRSRWKQEHDGIAAPPGKQRDIAGGQR